jgi:hypothetical protein
VEGPQGPQGETGPSGTQGPQGVSGPQGVEGPRGYEGVGGEDGAQGPTGSTGATGVQGPTGARGLQGLMGSVGATGAQGSTGATGATGDQGPIGEAGPIGDTGPAGTKMFYVSDNDDVLGLAFSTMIPTEDNNAETVPAFYSEGDTVGDGWAVAMKPVTIFWSNTSCQGVPYVKNGDRGGAILSNMLWWVPDGYGHLYRVDWEAADGVFRIHSRQYPIGMSNMGCVAVGSAPGALMDDILRLELVEDYMVKYSFPWRLVPEHAL